jgi:hypothetical protein
LSGKNKHVDRQSFAARVIEKIRFSQRGKIVHPHEKYFYMLTVSRMPK